MPVPQNILDDYASTLAQKDLDMISKLVDSGQINPEQGQALYLRLNPQTAATPPTRTAADDPYADIMGEQSAPPIDDPKNSLYPIVDMIRGGATEMYAPTKGKRPWDQNTEMQILASDLTPADYGGETPKPRSFVPDDIPQMPRNKLDTTTIMQTAPTAVAGQDDPGFGSSAFSPDELDEKLRQPNRQRRKQKKKNRKVKK